MNKRLYFAYGSNCNLEQMKKRCPKATAIEPVTLPGYRLTFKGNHYGVANIEKQDGSTVRGVLWEITPDCEKSLDFYEGFPQLYHKETVSITTEDGQTIKAMAYVMRPAPFRMPTPGYFDTILDGFRQNNIDEEPLFNALYHSYKGFREEVN